MANVKKFTDKTGIEVRVDNEGWEDVRPKAAVAANTGAGPDIILSTNDDANLYPDKLLDVTDLARLPGQEVRRLVPGRARPTCSPTARSGSACRSAPPASMIVYRESMVKAAGFDTFPKDTDGFLKLMKALKEKGTPGGMALGNATGDGLWCNWLIWAFGGKLVDKNNKVVIDSPETLKALEYGKELYATFIPGTLSWLDPNNNKAFLDGQISRHQQRHLDLLRGEELAPTRRSRRWRPTSSTRPSRSARSGMPTESHLFFNQMVMKYTKYPKAAKEFLRFMMEEEQFDAWLHRRGRLRRAAAGRLREAADLDLGPEAHAVPRRGEEPAAGRLCRASWATRRPAPLADFIVVNMVAEAISGSKTPKEAMERAQKRAERYYKV